MAKKNYLNQTQLQKALFARTEGYAANVRAIYQKAFQEVIDLVKGTELVDGMPFSFKDYGYSNEVTPIFRRMYSETYQTIRNGIASEWLNANENNDGLIKAIFGSKAVEDNHFAKYFKRNQEAMDAFFSRKTEGLNLSQKVWNFTGHYKTELENTLDLAIGEGTPAMQLAAKIKNYLNEPDRYYRRFRVKVGEDDEGKPIYGRKWKRRIWDKETDSYKWIDAKPSKYNSGKGVYRSSARNAQRLARTETNIAYREADYLRWQQEEFVVAIEIKLSNNHPVADICDDLKGIYPKDIKWTGWHPNCRCYMVPVLASKDELDQMLDAILNDEDPGDIECAGVVKEVPDNFNAWVKDNETRINTAKQNGTLPYFVKDNQKYVDAVLNPLSPEEKHKLELVEKYGADNVQKLFDSYDAFLQKIAGGDTAFQLKKLKFETTYVADNNKYVTSGEMAKMLQKRLDEVQKIYDKEQAVNAATATGVLSYKCKSEPFKKIVEELKLAIKDPNSSVANIQDLTAKAQTKMLELEKSRLAKAAKSQSWGNAIDLYATDAEKLELVQLKAAYDKFVSSGADLWGWDARSAGDMLADRQRELIEKYLPKQGKIKKLNGETAASAADARSKYLSMPYDSRPMNPVGGDWTKNSSCYEKQLLKDYSKATGIPVEELGFINRYSYGSKWCNQFTYGLDPMDYDGKVQLFNVATNDVLEKLPRYQGTVYSGIDFGSRLTDYINEMKNIMSNGGVYVNKALMSTSTNIYTTSTFGTDVICVIKSKTGADIKTISHYHGENEVIMRAGTRYKVINVYQETAKQYTCSGRGWVVMLEEI